MPPSLPRPMHPPHPIRQSTRDPIPREHQLLSLSQTDIHIVRNRRQRQRPRRLTNRTDQHPRRPAPSSASSRIRSSGIVCIRLGAGAGRSAIAMRIVREFGFIARDREIFRATVVAGERPVGRPQRRTGCQLIPPVVIGSVRTVMVIRIGFRHIHHTPAHRFESLYESWHVQEAGDKFAGRFPGVTGKERKCRYGYDCSYFATSGRRSRPRPLGSITGGVKRGEGQASRIACMRRISAVCSAITSVAHCSMVR